VDRPSFGMEIAWEGEAAERMVVAAIVPGGVADAGGFLVGDAITKMGGLVPVEFVRNAPRAGAVRVELLRDGAHLARYLEFPPAVGVNAYDTQKDIPNNSPNTEAAQKPAEPEPPRRRARHLTEEEAEAEEQLRPMAEAFLRIFYQEVKTPVARFEQVSGESIDCIVPGLAAEIAKFEDDIHVRYSAPRIDMSALGLAAYGLRLDGEVFSRQLGRVCDAIEAASEPGPVGEKASLALPDGAVGETIGAGRCLIEEMRAIARILRITIPPDDAPLTQFAGFSQGFFAQHSPDNAARIAPQRSGVDMPWQDAAREALSRWDGNLPPPMGGLSNLKGWDNSRDPTSSQNDQPAVRPMGGAMEWQDAHGAPIEWSKGARIGYMPDYSGWNAGALHVEIGRLEGLLSKPLSEASRARVIRQRDLAIRRCLGLPPEPAKPAEHAPPPSPQPLDDEIRRRLVDAMIDRDYPAAVGYRTALDGATVRQVDPKALRAVENKIALLSSKDIAYEIAELRRLARDTQVRRLADDYQPWGRQ
jgi:hypothetical protein